MSSCTPGISLWFVVDVYWGCRCKCSNIACLQQHGTVDEVKQFNDWLGKLPYKHKIVIGGSDYEHTKACVYINTHMRIRTCARMCKRIEDSNTFILQVFNELIVCKRFLGNHDLVCDARTYARNCGRLGASPTAPADCVGREAMQRLLSNATYLQDDSAVVAGGLVVYGAPWQPPIPGGHPMAAFDMGDAEDTDGRRAAKWDLIPPRVDVLLTHTPPRGS